MAAETICEIIFEKAAGTVWCGIKKVDSLFSRIS